MFNLSIASAAARAVQHSLAERALPAVGSRFDQLMLNPQPLPPKASLFDRVMLNPQPLPPKASSLFDQVMLNPQPLPPKASSLFSGPLSRLIDDCGTVVPRRPIPTPPHDPRAALEALLGGAGLPGRPPIPFF